MAITNGKIAKGASIAVKHVVVPVNTLTASATTTVYATQPTDAYVVTGVEVFATGTITNTQVDVQVNGVSVLTGVVTPVAGTITNGTLVGTAATLKGTKSQPLTVKTVCGATPAAPNLAVTVRYRPRPLNGELL